MVLGQPSMVFSGVMALFPEIGTYETLQSWRIYNSRTRQTMRSFNEFTATRLFDALMQKKIQK